MLDLLLNSFPLRASIAAMLALAAIVAVFAGLIVMIRFATPRGQKGSRPDPVHGPQESLDLKRGGSGEEPRAAQ